MANPFRAAGLDLAVKFDAMLLGKLDLLLDQNVGQLKKFLSSLVNVVPAKIRLFFQDPESWSGLEELKLLGVMLYSLGIKDGDQLIIEVSALSSMAIVIGIRFICRKRWNPKLFAEKSTHVLVRLHL